MKPPEHALGVALLGIPAMLYGAAVSLRNRYYDRPAARRRAGVPVISVGNLTAGGTGKTPVVAWLARHLLERGIRPAVVSRGYGGRAGRGPLLVSGADGPRCGPEVCGDEPYLLASWLGEVPVIVGSDRVAGARAAAGQGAHVVLLDDGFQHRRLERDLDVVLLDASNPFGQHRLLPAGLLREPVAGLARADVILITRSRPGEPFAVIERVVRHHNPDVPILRSGHRATGFVNHRGTIVEPPGRAVAFCGIGNPYRFRIDLHEAGVEVVAFRGYADHHVYTPAGAELERLAVLAAARDAVLVTTEKDRVRVGSALDAGSAALLVFRIEAELYEPDPLVALVSRALAGAPC